MNNDLIQDKADYILKRFYGDRGYAVRCVDVVLEYIDQINMIHGDILNNDNWKAIRKELTK